MGDIFRSFPALSLAQGSTTSFKIQHETYMPYAGANGDVGDVGFENEHLQVTAGLYGLSTCAYTHDSLVTLNGALRYTLASASDTNSPTTGPTKAPTKAPIAAKTGKTTKS